ncbi:hypothetical protein [Sporosarcina sp. FSL K6-5500]|uniref:hypothetical protein n=1 Tax=Sporosarcina sp. FSL K6-5500 TaxID=2921558 RepID=UPI0030F5278E
MESGQGRKVRSDKKWSVQPTISIELRDCIHRLSKITGEHIKDVIEAICVSGIDNKKVITYLSSNFRQDIRINNTLYIGDSSRASVKKRTAPGQSERVSTRVSGTMHVSLKALAYSLDCSAARACALLVDATVRDADFINEFVKEFLEKHVDSEQMRELKKVLKYVKANNPYEEDVSWAALLSYLIEEVRTGAEKVQDTITGFVINNWKQ